MVERAPEVPRCGPEPFAGLETMVGPSIMLYNLMGMFGTVLEGLASLERMLKKRTLVVSIAFTLEARLKTLFAQIKGSSTPTWWPNT